IRGPRRRALIARDRHCQWPGCERPASWCDGHHIVFWAHGGGDDLENLCLLAPVITGRCTKVVGGS
ncbi:MAG TPA: HNH endonuclease signature motif containing protein, partial [Verrucomicrobiae bacterium]|nr:HNH endonuclease signature motif containing protein [Verrucomicrobiae bacterium]